MNLIIYILLSLISSMPRILRLFLGRQLGTLIYLVGLRKKVAAINIKIAFPELGKLDIELLLLKCYKHFGMVFMDFINQIHINKKNLSNTIIMRSKDKKILQDANGGIIMSAHFGNWESVLPAIGLNNIKMETVVREQKNSLANDYYIKLRSFPNISLIWNKNALKKLYNAISNKEFIGLASDQNARTKGIFLPFFEKEASFPKGSGIFYSREKCNLFIFLCIMGSDYKYYSFVKSISSDKVNEDDIIHDITLKYIKILENKIKQNPHQYFWFHKKWDKKIYK